MLNEIILLTLWLCDYTSLQSIPSFLTASHLLSLGGTITDIICSKLELWSSGAVQLSPTSLGNFRPRSDVPRPRRYRQRMIMMIMMMMMIMKRDNFNNDNDDDDDDNDDDHNYDSDDNNEDDTDDDENDDDSISGQEVTYQGHAGTGRPVPSPLYSAPHRCFILFQSILTHLFFNHICSNKRIYIGKLLRTVTSTSASAQRTEPSWSHPRKSRGPPPCTLTSSSPRAAMTGTWRGRELARRSGRSSCLARPRQSTAGLSSTRPMLNELTCDMIYDDINHIYDKVFLGTLIRYK